MSNLLKILFIALTFFYSNAEYSTPAKPNPIENLRTLMRNWKAHSDTDICFVHAINTTQNVSVAETSCRALISLKKTCTNKHHLTALKRSLAFVQENTTCVAPEKRHMGEEDLFTFLNKLYGYFLRQNTKKRIEKH